MTGGCNADARWFARKEKVVVRSLARLETAMRQREAGGPSRLVFCEMTGQKSQRGEELVVVEVEVGGWSADPARFQASCGYSGEGDSAR